MRRSSPATRRRSSRAAARIQELVTANPGGGWFDGFRLDDRARRHGPRLRPDGCRRCAGERGAEFSAAAPCPWLHSPGTSEGHELLRYGAAARTLERLVDFDRINTPEQMRFSVGGIVVRTGNLSPISTPALPSAPPHIKARQAHCRPALPGRGDRWGVLTGTAGSSPNTPPIEWVVEREGRRGHAYLQVDLECAGPIPRHIANVMSRAGDSVLQPDARCHQRRPPSPSTDLQLGAGDSARQQVPADLKAGLDMRLLE